MQTALRSIGTAAVSLVAAIVALASVAGCGGHRPPGAPRRHRDRGRVPGELFPRLPALPHLTWPRSLRERSQRSRLAGLGCRERGPRGTAVDDNDEAGLARRYPRLAARFR